MSPSIFSDGNRGKIYRLFAERHAANTESIAMKQIQGLKSLLLVATLAFSGAGVLQAGITKSVTQANGDADRPPAKFSGQTFDVINGSTVLKTNYTAPRFSERALAMTDRLHEWNKAATNVPLPGYLVGAEYVLIANNNRDNTNLTVTVELQSPAWIYLLIDNRVGDDDPATPPNFTSFMNWVTTDGWTPVANGINRSASKAVPDEVGYDENGDGSINQYASIYVKLVTNNAVTVLQQGESRNMYGVVVAPALIESIVTMNGDPAEERPEPKFTTQNYDLQNGSTIVATNYTVPFFGEDVYAMTDRNHQWNSASATNPLPAYLLGNEYIAIANNYRDNAGLQLDITLRGRAYVYLLIDNRIGDGDSSNPPEFEVSGMMPWVATEGWKPVTNGLNRAANSAWPDEVGYDEGADGSINTYASVYAKIQEAGVFSTYDQNEGRNIYGLVVAPALLPVSPTKLTVLQVGDGKATIGWAPTEGGWNYTVKRATTAGGPYTTVISGLGATAFEDTGLANGTKYYYIVSASNLGGDGPNSEEISATPMSSPGNLVAVGGVEKVNLTWDALPGATNYAVKRSLASGGPYEKVAQSQTTAYADTGLASGRTYYYVIQASMTGGGDSGISLEAAGTTAPSAPTASVEVFAATALRIKWSTTNLVVTEFIVEQSTDGTTFTEAGKVPGNTRSFEIGGLAVDKTYYFRVSARNDTGTSATSVVASGKTPVWGLNVNFANSGFTTGVTGYPIAGYLDDYGDMFMDRGNGIAYGWLEDNTANSRYRNSDLSPDWRYDTLNHLQKNGGDMVWEIAVTNGAYSVHIVAGDATAVDSVFQFSVEDQITGTKTPATGAYWAEFNQNCTVNDGSLTIRSGPEAANNKICFIDIYPAPTEPPVITSKELSGGNITIQWTGGGTLQSTTNLAAPASWTDAGTGGTFTEPAMGSAKFYRVRR